MEVLQAIQTRRSVRKYLDKPVEREKINECLEAARLAPSACNSQPWHYIVIDDPKVKEAFCKEAFSGPPLWRWGGRTCFAFAVSQSRYQNAHF